MRFQRVHLSTMLLHIYALLSVIVVMDISANFFESILNRATPQPWRRQMFLLASAQSKSIPGNRSTHGVVIRVIASTRISNSNSGRAAGYALQRLLDKTVSDPSSVAGGARRYLIPPTPRAHTLTITIIISCNSDQRQIGHIKPGLEERWLCRVSWKSA